MFQIKRAENKEDIEHIRGLFREYEAWLGLDLCFQQFDEEVRGLPGRYSPPEGSLYLALVKNEAAGCIASRKIGHRICEMKRLYIRDNARGLGFGNLLIEQIIKDAQTTGYRKMRLDTYPPKMAKAVKLYESHGFYEIPPYYENPYDGVLFMEKVL